MVFDRIFVDKIESLERKYPEYSVESELVVEVSGWLHSSTTSLIPNSAITVAENAIERYKTRRDIEFDGNLARELSKIVSDAKKIYGEVKEVYG